MENNRFMVVKLRERRDIEGISLFHYVTNGINPEKDALRNLVFKFKGETLSSELFREFLAEKISQYLPLILGCKKEDLVLLCVPTSKKSTVETRYKGFCDKLNSMGLKADYTTLYLNEDVTTKHTSYYGFNSNSNSKTFSECLRANRENLKDLKGKEIATIGKGLTPDIILQTLLKKNGLDQPKDIKIDYLGSGNELAPLYLSGKKDIVVIAEPMASKILSKDKNSKANIELNQEWKNLFDVAKGYPQSTLIVSENICF